jgi:hypothetical protein
MQKNGLSKCSLVPEIYLFKKYKFWRQRANLVAPSVFIAPYGKNSGSGIADYWQRCQRTTEKIAVAE